VNISGIQRRTERVEAQAEANNNQGSRDIVIDVRYYDIIDTAEGRKDMPVPAEYDDVNWQEIPPKPDGTRIAVRYPRSENLGDANQKCDWRCLVLSR
jgi:hypothetical protein